MLHQIVINDNEFQPATKKSNRLIYYDSEKVGSLLIGQVG